MPVLICRRLFFLLSYSNFGCKFSYMQATATVKLKLDVTAQVSELLSETQAAYVRALNLTSAVAYEKRCKNAVALHHLTYRDVRDATRLPANLVCSARAVVAEAYKRELDKSHKWRDGTGVRYDARTLTLKLKQERATLTTLKGRANVGLVVSDYHRQYLSGEWEIASTATLKRQGKAWYLHLVATRDVPEAEGSNVVGLDAGIKRIATLSTGKTFKGGSISQLRRRRFKQRRVLQRKPEGQKKSRNQRRLLNRLSGRERRAVEWKLWNVANEVVREAIRTGSNMIAIEDLKRIRERVKVARQQRIILHGWPFSSLFAKIRHVASRHGITVAEVDAHHTSRTCSRCGHCEKANRKTQSDFRCLSCGYSQNADLNGSFNIRARYVALECSAVNRSLTSVVTSRGDDRAKAA